MPMALMTKEDRDRMLSRVMVFGPPNTRKTTSVITTAVYPVALISCPGEKGWGTIPTDVKGLLPFIWRKAGHDVQTSESIIREVRQTVIDIMAGKYDEQAGGKIQTLAVEGYHKLYGEFLNVVSGGKYFEGEKVDPFEYPRAAKMSARFLNLCLEAPIPYVTFTTWNTQKLDKPGDMAGPRHTWPAIPGSGAKEMAGEFSVVCISRLKPKSPGSTEMVGEFSLKPDAEVWGNSVKMDPRYVKKLPAACPQDFKQLYKIVRQAQEEAEGEDKPTVA